MSLRGVSNGFNLYLLNISILNHRLVLVMQMVQLLQPPVTLLQLLENSVLLQGVLVGLLGLQDFLSVPWSRCSWDIQTTLLTY